MYYFIATDNGKSNNTFLDTHELIWASIEEVEDKLSYDSLKNIWRKVKDFVLNVK